MSKLEFKTVNGVLKAHINEILWYQITGKKLLLVVADMSRELASGDKASLIEYANSHFNKYF